MLGSMGVVSLALEMRDAYTQSHCSRSVRLATELGNVCGVVEAELDRLRVCARYHDIGKIGVPDAVLLKPGHLTDEDWVLMKSHSAFGGDLILTAGITDSALIADAVRHHHEAFDGSGYPDGLCGDAIPLISRILLVVDAYDAMTTSRPYHHARPHETVMEILRSEVGKKLDPTIFDKFSSMIEHSPARAH